MKWMLFLGLPALLVLASGCGLDQSPVAPEEEILVPAAKIAQVRTSSSSKVVGSAGDTLWVKYGPIQTLGSE